MWSTFKYIFKYRQKTVDRWMMYISVVCALLVLFHIGYNTDAETALVFDKLVVILFYTLMLLGASRTLISILVSKKIEVAHSGGLVLFLYFLVIAVARMMEDGTASFLVQPEWLYLGIFAVFLTELSKSSLFFDNFYFNPTILFVCSFLILILIGTLLLMLPKTMSNDQMEFVDALFMATSAVCITGLSVVDVATQFTGFGQTVILILMQLGGLGIMTFTGFFGYFFSGGFSYKNQLMYSEILGHNKVGSVINALLKIIFMTLFFEGVGIILLFFTVDASVFHSTEDHVFFSVFHAVSAFCNAGFSTIPEGFQNPLFRFQYSIHLIIAVLFLLGGLGFGIVLNLYAFAKRWAVNVWQKVFYAKPFTYKAWVINFNSRLIAWTTLVLIVLATLSTFMLEYNHTLLEHETAFGKWVTAFFMGNTPRSAGYSTVNMNGLSFSTVMVLLFMMWIGSSPGSTGGGIKTTTFAVALLNIVSLAKGKDSLEIFQRKISGDSVNKAFAIIALSLWAIGSTVLAISITDGDKPLGALVFESFSAYTTSGLSMGITSSLSDGGKFILTCSMFVGRVGLLTLLVALVKNTKSKTYIFPQEKVLF